MRDYLIGPTGSPVGKPVAAWDTASLRAFIGCHKAGKFKRESPDAPSPEAMLDRLEIELVARRLRL